MHAGALVAMHPVLELLTYCAWLYTVYSVFTAHTGQGVTKA